MYPQSPLLTRHQFLQMLEPRAGVRQPHSLVEQRQAMRGHAGAAVHHFEHQPIAGAARLDDELLDGEGGVDPALGESARDRTGYAELGEGLLTAFSSSALACVLALPLTFEIVSQIGRLSFLAPLPFVVSPWAVVGWLGSSAIFSSLSSWIPARRAAAISVRQALVEL